RFVPPESSCERRSPSHLRSRVCCLRPNGAWVTSLGLMSMTLQGWNPDPFGRFEHRYFSNGAPTTLVRTGTIEQRDEPGDRAETEISSSFDVSREANPAGPRPWLYERRQRRA